MHTIPLAVVNVLVTGGIVALVIVVVVLGVFFSPAARIKRRLKQTKVAQIGEAQTGELVRITGNVCPDELSLTAPFSGRMCAWYSATVEEYRSSGKSGHWHTIITEERFTDFTLEDPTGRALVRMIVPKVASNTDHGSRSGTFDDATRVEEDFLRRNGRQSTGFFGFNRKLRYREAIFEVGERVTVLGRMAEATSRYGPRTMEADPEVGLLLSDDPSTVG